MNDTIDYQHKPALLNAKTRLEFLESIPDSQWNIAPADNNGTQVYTCIDSNEISTIRVVKELDSTRTNLGSFQASLSSIELRGIWCPWLQNIKLLGQPSASINVIQASITLEKSTSNVVVLVEKTTKKDDNIQFVSVSTSSNDSYFMACDLSSTRANIYYQWDKSGSITYTGSVLSKALTDFIDLKSFSWISQYDLNTIQCLCKNQNQNKLEMNYTYLQENTSASAVDIQQKLHRNQQQRWHSGSWDQQKQDSYNQTVRKNKFLSSSSLVFTTTSPQLRPISTSRASYPENSSRKMIVPWATEEELEEDQLHTTRRLSDDRDDLRLEVKDNFNLTVSLPQNPSWSDRFSQLCVRCYRRPTMSDHDYVIQIVHPQNLIEYLCNEEDFQEENDTLKQLDDDLSGHIHVNLLLKKSDNGQCMVNNREWPIRTWTISSEEDNDCDDDDDEEDEEVPLEDEQDIFVDGMEEIDHETSPPPITETAKMRLPVMKPSSSAPVPSVINQDKKSVDVYTQPNFISDLNIPATALSPPVKTKTNQSQTIADNKRKKQVEQQAQIITPSNQLNLPSLSLTEDIDHQVEEQEEILETVLPEHDPAALQKVYPQFVEYLQPSYKPVPTIIQPPDRENGNVTIKKIDITNHPMGGYLSESIWKDCSIWDVKAVLESAGARKIWDNTFDNTAFLHALTPTSSLWHTKMKGAWPNNPRDYVYFHGQYSAGSYRIDLLSTSCFGESYQYKPLPAQEVPGYMRATMDVSGSRLERIDDRTTSVKQLMVTQFSTWVIGFITSRFLVQSCAAVQSARDYLQTYGAPPSLENLACGLLVNVKHDHERRNWRCEYIRRISGVENTDVDGTTKKVTAAGHNSPSTVSLIRLDKRRWATNNQYAIVIDPPPSRVSAVERFNDPYGVWLTVEHDEAFIIPLRGKILVLIKPEQAVKPPMEVSECQLYVNGVPTTIQIEERKPKSIIRRSKQASFPQVCVKDEQEQVKSELQLKDSTLDKTVPSATAISAPQKSETVAPSANEEEKILTAINQLSISPKEHAQAALAFLKQTDEQFGWTVLSDSKSGMRISKKSGTKNNSATDNSKKTDKNDSVIEGIAAANTNKNHVLQVFEPYMVYKGSKVIENFSVEEVAAVVTDIGHVRKAYDDTIEREGLDLVHQIIGPGCRVIRLTMKALFPFKNREVYAISCLAEEEASSTTSTKRTFYVESSLPDFPTINSKKTRGHLFISGWILEAIDPYNTTTENHPIPSMRATYVAALDLGNAVPSYISNLVANNWFPKKINAIEAYLKSKGPPPFTTQPNVALIYTNNTLSVNSAATSSDISWTCSNSTYDDQHQFKMTSRFKILEANTKAEPANKKKPKKEDILVLSPSTSSSTSSTAPPYRRPSNHTISSDPNSRRGSLQTNALPKKRIMPVVPITPASAPIKSSSNDRSYTILQTTFDLRNYTKGYEIQAQLYQIFKDTDHRKNITNKLVLSISEPSLSHLMDGKKKLVKHCITMKAHGLAMSTQYEFEFSLVPLHEETAISQGQKLTVSHVLGEDEDEQVKDTWHGLIMVNGVEALLNKDIHLKSLHPEETTIENTSGINDALAISDNNMINLTGVDSREITAEELYSNRTMDVEDGAVGQRGAQYTGGSVVATALGNVSAGVNNFGARMMIPFRAASFSLSTNNNEPLSRSEQSSTFVSETTDDDDDTMESTRRRRFTKDEKRMISSSTAGTTLHEIRMLRRSSDTMRKGMLLLMICLGLAVVFALLMIQPMMERYYASFSVSSSVNVLDKSIEQGIVRRLLQIPWFGGWDIQVIAVRRQ